MENDNENKINPKFIIGKPFPLTEITQDMEMEECYFDFLKNGNILFICKTDDCYLSRFHLNSFKYGAMSIGVFYYKKEPAFCVYQRNILTAIMQFVPEDFIKRSENNKRLPICLCAIDKNNIIKALRYETLDETTTNAVFSAIEFKQSPEYNLSEEESDKIINDIRKEYEEGKIDVFREANALCAFEENLEKIVIPELWDYNKSLIKYIIKDVLKTFMKKIRSIFSTNK